MIGNLSVRHACVNFSNIRAAPVHQEYGDRCYQPRVGLRRGLHDFGAASAQLAARPKVPDLPFQPLALLCAGEHMELVGTTEAMTDASVSQVRAGMAGSAQVTWRKSSWSTYNGNCVEVAQLADGQVGVRDTKDMGSGPVLVFGAASWRSFLDAVKGELGYRS